MLDLLWFRILGLFGLIFDSFWGRFGIPGQGSVFGDLVSLGFHYGRSGASFWAPGDTQMVDFDGLRLSLGSNLEAF